MTTSQPHQIIQLTDLHLSDESGIDEGASYQHKKIDTTASFLDVLKDAQEDQPSTDFFVVTGDIAQYATPTVYQRFIEIIKKNNIQAHCIPGNHDDLSMMRDAFNNHPLLHLNGHRDVGHWRMIFLDSSQLDNSSGFLKPSEQQRLEQLLQQSSDKHLLIFLHHHPVATGSAWLDKIRLENNEIFFNILSASKQVKAVFCGHIHQELAQEHAGIKIYGSPSTCVQFKPQQTNFAIDVGQPPAYRWLKLHDNGHLETSIRYVHAALQE